MVDVNTQAADVKGYGMPVVPTITAEDRVKPQVTAVKDTSNGDSVSLNDRSLHGNTAEAQKRQRAMSRDEIGKAVEEIQDRLNSIGANLTIGLNQDTKSEAIVVKVTERNTGELIRQVPSEEILNLKKKLEDLVGILFDSKA